MAEKTRSQARVRRHQRVRKRIRGTAARPRLAVFRSLAHIHAQLIDDDARRTLVSASDLNVGPAPASPAPASPAPAGPHSTAKMDSARAVGTLLGEKAKAAGITEIVFDRGGYRYHGRVKALADAVRQAGMRF